MSLPETILNNSTIDIVCTGEGEKATSTSFLKSISNLSNPYDQGNTSQKIESILEQLEIINNVGLIKKLFYDLQSLK